MRRSQRRWQRQKATFFHVRPENELGDHKHPSVDKQLDEAALWRMGGVFRQPWPLATYQTSHTSQSVRRKYKVIPSQVMLTVGLTLLSNEHQSHNHTSKTQLD